MKTIIKGRHIEITEALRNYLEKKLNKLDKHFDSILEATVALSVEKKRQIVEVTLQASKAIIRVEVETGDMYASIDKVVDRLERKIQKYKEKYLKKPHPRAITGKNEIEKNESGLPEKVLNKSYNIVKTKRFAVKPMSVEEAAMQMDLLGHSFFVFANDQTNIVNVLYKRKDGNFGLIEPEF